MSRRFSGYPEAVPQILALFPVEFNNFFRIVAPVFQMFAGAKSGDDVFSSREKFRNRIVIQVIPVVVRDDEVIEFRDISRLLYICTLKSLRRK